MTLEEAKILVVDDEVILCGMYAKWLKMSGCREVRTANDGQAALDILYDDVFDVLVSDVQMPLVDGIELLRRLTEDGHRVACVVFVSSFSQVDRGELARLGVDVFLAKPFRREELVTAVQSGMELANTRFSGNAAPSREQTH